MEIVIDIDRDVPEFARFWIGLEVTALVAQIRGAVEAGAVKAGDALPSARQLATDLEVDGDTVAKAYRLLQGESVLRIGAFGRVFVRGAASVDPSRGPTVP